jgi:signal peptidase I
VANPRILDGANDPEPNDLGQSDHLGPCCGGSLPAEDAPLAIPAGASTRKREDRGGLVEALVLVLIALVLALTLKTYVAEAYEIKGKSMEGTFKNGQRVVVLKSFFDVARGDIIVFASCEDPSKDLIKRVVGLPGETVSIRAGRVYIDGRELEEEYIDAEHRSYRDPPREWLVPSGRYFVLGDNRPDSHDSRYFKSIPAESIKGKVVARWWPFSEVRSF